jgi:hypothetical protein
VFFSRYYERGNTVASIYNTAAGETQLNFISNFTKTGRFKYLGEYKELFIVDDEACRKIVCSYALLRQDGFRIGSMVFRTGRHWDVKNIFTLDVKSNENYCFRALVYCTVKNRGAMYMFKTIKTITIETSPMTIKVKFSGMFYAYLSPSIYRFAISNTNNKAVGIIRCVANRRRSAFNALVNGRTHYIHLHRFCLTGVFWDNIADRVYFVINGQYVMSSSPVGISNWHGWKRTYCYTFLTPQKYVIFDGRADRLIGCDEQCPSTRRCRVTTIRIHRKHTGMPCESSGESSRRRPLL